MEPAGADHFVSGLSGPGALQLVVELAHDLRSPLTSILYMSETLMRGESGGVNDVQRRQLEMVYAAALRLSALTSDVIELAEGGGQLADREPTSFSIREVFESVADMVEPLADEKGLDVRTILPLDDCRVGHRSALCRVLLNLSINALKFTDYGYVEIAAIPSSHGRLRLSVQDTGPGIAHAALATLARPFRASPAPNEYLVCETGLGLTICQKLLQAMDSQLEVETRPGQGTRFHFELDLPLAGQCAVPRSEITTVPSPVCPGVSASAH